MEYSVLMPIYYKENPLWFECSIMSMLNQTVKPDEIVIVKDGPLTIELDGVIDKVRSEYRDLIKIVELKENVGLGRALNKGILECKNEFIARMDSDDYCKSERVEKQLNILVNNPKIGMVGTNVIEFIDNHENVVSYVDLPENSKSILSFSKRRNPFRHPSVLYKKSEVLAAGNYSDCMLFEDYDLWTRMLSNGCECYNIQEYLTYMRVNEDFYRRRGGFSYLKNMATFKRTLLQRGYLNFGEFCVTLIPHAIVCVLPNIVRDCVYKKFLRRKNV